MDLPPTVADVFQNPVASNPEDSLFTVDGTPALPRPVVVERMRQLGAGTERIKILLNRVSGEHLIAPKQIETALGISIHHQFTSDYRTVSTALNSGVPLAMTNSTELASQFDSFTRHLVGMAVDVKPEPETKRVFLGIF